MDGGLGNELVVGHAFNRLHDLCMIPVVTTSPYECCTNLILFANGPTSIGVLEPILLFSD